MDLCRNLVKWSLWPAALGLAVVIGLSPAAGQDDGDAAANEAGLQELTRGPVHEAFAEPITFNPKPGLVVKKEPPQAIEELPPEQKPDGENVAFIGGYWAFDDDKDDWIYISGIWRVIPPGKQWVAGYWNKIDDGHQWVAGYWGSASSEEAPAAGAAPAGKHKVEYYPEPPKSLEIGANTEPPSADHIWVSGCYLWYDNHYMWRGGYWVVSRPDWVWVPAHFVWTPCGYVFCEGRWDLVPTKRAVMFAPCYITRAVYTRPRFVYCPRLVIDFNVCSDHFFCRPSYSHYYFGDYYADTYVSFGITPWFRHHYSGGHYCPIYSHYRWTHARDNTRWEVELRDRYRHRVAHIEHRPARTFVQQQTIINNITVNKTTNVTNVNVHQMALAKPLKEVVKQDPKVSNMTFVKVDQKDRQQLALNAKETRKLSDQRLTLESNAAKEQRLTRPKPGTGAGAGATGAITTGKPLTLEMPNSKVESKPIAKLGKGTPPPLPTGAIRPRGGDKPVVGGGTGSPGGGTGGANVGGPGKTGTGAGGAGTGSTGTGKPGPGAGGGTGSGSVALPGKTGSGTGANPGGASTGASTGAGKPPGGTVGNTGGVGTGGGNTAGGKPPMGAGGSSIIGPGKPGGSPGAGTGTPTKTGAGGNPGGNKPPDKSGRPFSDGSAPPGGGSFTPPGGGSFKPNPSGGSTPPPPPGGETFKTTPPPGGASAKPGTPPSTGSGNKPPPGSGTGNSTDTGKGKKKEKN